MNELTSNMEQICSYTKIRNCITDSKQYDEKNRTIKHYISTPDKDRAGDVVNPYGIIKDDFEKTRTVFYNHNRNHPIAKNLWLVSEDKGVLALTKFSSTDFGNDVYTLHKEGIINTWSIGFRIPKIEGAFQWDEKTQTMFINQWELIEYSSAPLAMNPNCLDQAKSIVKSNDLINECERLEADLRIHSMLNELDKRLKQLKNEVNHLNQNNQINDLENIKSELKKINKKILSTGIVGDLKTLSKEEINNMVTRAISGIIGKKLI